ncbi:MAG: hypothetical protein AMXMBFR84_37680 [Candidatus Hydrogenedentota bacterium]
MDPHTYIMRKGKYAGRQLVAVPSHYLRRIVQQKVGEWKIAEIELRRRGTDVPTVDVTAHAIDRASFRLLDHWRGTRVENEGLYTWLARLCDAALRSRKLAVISGDDTEIRFCGIKFIFAGRTKKKPVLKTLTPLDDGILTKRQAIEGISLALGRARKKGRDHGKLSGEESHETGT